MATAWISILLIVVMTLAGSALTSRLYYGFYPQYSIAHFLGEWVAPRFPGFVRQLLLTVPGEVMGINIIYGLLALDLMLLWFVYFLYRVALVFGEGADFMEAVTR